MPLGTARNVRLLVLGNTVPGCKGEIEEETAVERDLGYPLTIDDSAQAGRLGLNARSARLDRNQSGRFAHAHVSRFVRVTVAPAITAC